MGRAGLHPDHPGGKRKIRQRDGYLIETSTIESWPYRLELGIRAADDFMLTMARDGSDDLINWYPVDRQTLARLSYQGYLVEQKADAPISQRLKYLRLSWPADEEDIHIDSVTAVSWISGAPPPRNWIRLRGRPEKDEKHPAILRLNFESPGFMPVEEVRISFTGYRNLVQAKLRSRLDENSPWIQRGQGTYYLLQLEGTVLRNDTLTIAPASDRFWQLEMQSEGENPASLPDLELGWRPHELYFVAQGPGPYVLAFDNGQMAKDVRPEAGITTLVQEAEKKSLPIAAATLRGEMVLDGPARLSPLPPPLPWKKWLFWAVLIGGVLLIGRMAFTLHRQMRN